jgi:dipeptidyl aminopeptidase/acylaminoacyl peptidase
MPPDYDWHDVQSVDHQDGDPLARFAPETPAPAQQIAPPGGVAQPGGLAQLCEPAQPRELAPPRAIAEPRVAALPAEPGLYYTPAPDPRPVRIPRQPTVLTALATGLTVSALYVWSSPPRRLAPDAATASTTGTEPAPAPAKTADAANSVAAPVATDTAAPRPLLLAVDGGAYSPTFDAAGATLFFHAGRAPARLARTTLDAGGNPQAVVALVGGTARNYHARVSPDGRLIAFDSDRDGERAVYLAQADGSNIRRISSRGYAELPSWSPDGKWLAFVRGEPRRSQVWNLWVRNMRSAATRRVTSFRTGQTWTAAWFPDNRRLAFSHDDQLTVLDIMNGRAQAFRSPKKNVAVRTPAVSPDGQRVIFQVVRDGAWLLDVRSGKMKQVLDDPSAEEFAWDPRGGRVVYQSRRNGEWRIWIAHVE